MWWGGGGALGGGALSGGLSAGGALGCWVAREVYGENNPKWIKFREWLTTRGPSWLFNLYVKHGERFAAYIKDKPAIKWFIRKLMDLAIKGKK